MEDSLETDPNAQLFRRRNGRPMPIIVLCDLMVKKMDCCTCPGDVIT